MSKKFKLSDAEKWFDSRFRKLSVNGKICYWFIWDNCDSAGFYEITDLDLMSFLIGISKEDLNQGINEVVESRNDDGKQTIFRHENLIWVSYYVKSQQHSMGRSFDALNPKNGVHKGIVKNLVRGFEKSPELFSVSEISEYTFNNFVEVVHGQRVTLNENESKVNQLSITNESKVNQKRIKSESNLIHQRNTSISISTNINNGVENLNLIFDRLVQLRTWHEQLLFQFDTDRPSVGWVVQQLERFKSKLIAEGDERNIKQIQQHFARWIITQPRETNVGPRRKIVS